MTFAWLSQVANKFHAKVIFIDVKFVNEVICVNYLQSRAKAETLYTNIKQTIHKQVFCFQRPRNQAKAWFVFNWTLTVTLKWCLAWWNENWNKEAKTFLFILVKPVVWRFKEIPFICFSSGIYKQWNLLHMMSFVMSTICNNKIFAISFMPCEIKNNFQFHQN
jgi:hypothetical protein